MALSLTRVANLVWRRYIIDGNVGSGEYKPSKPEIALWGTELETALGGHIGSTANTAHPEATGSVRGFLSAADKTKLDAMTDIVNESKNGLVPIGSIILWSGSVASIPANWQLCDGTNGTSDLRNRFVVGAGDDYAVGATGGADAITLTDANLPAHVHSVSITTGNDSPDHSHAGFTDTQGAHSHPPAGGAGLFFRGGVAGVNSGLASGFYNNLHDVVGATGIAGSHAHNVTTYGASARHQHSVSGNTGSVGSGTAFDNRPRYYALAYIQRIS